MADHRIRIEGQIATGLPFSTPILISCKVADLRQPGRRGRRALVVDGRAASETAIDPVGSQLVGELWLPGY